jgi:formylglycine-generating enzyme required for sulfatase activity
LDGRAYPWGNDTPSEQLCWQRGMKAEKRRTCPVGSYPQGASPFGVLDMAGNVAEWTASGDAEAAGSGAFIVRGGGYWVDELASPDYYDVRADKSDSRADTRIDPYVGFRCAKSLTR